MNANGEIVTLLITAQFPYKVLSAVDSQNPLGLASSRRRWSWALLAVIAIRLLSAAC